MGDLHACRDALSKIRAKRDEANDRVLLVNVAIASGDWTSLGSFVEEEWLRREKRSPEELLRAGQLAHQIGSGRAKVLISGAVARAPDDPKILIGSYGAAVAAGWENEQTTTWLERAAALSGEDGPVKKMSLQEVFDRGPEWQQRESRTWEQLASANMPIFGAAQLLNRTLFELALIPAIANAEATDPRRRALIYAYSGARGFIDGMAKTAAFDPTSLLTLGLVGAIDWVFAQFDKVVVPHATLGWLFEEKQRVQFHQPSKYVDARALKRLIDSKFLQKI